MKARTDGVLCQLGARPHRRLGWMLSWAGLAVCKDEDWVKVGKGDQKGVGSVNCHIVKAMPQVTDRVPQGNVHVFLGNAHVA